MKNFHRFLKVLALMVVLAGSMIGTAYAVAPVEQPQAPSLVRCDSGSCLALSGVTSVQCSAQGCQVTFMSFRNPGDPDRGLATMFCDSRGCLAPREALANVASNKLPNDCHDERCLIEFKTP